MQNTRTYISLEFRSINYKCTRPVSVEFAKCRQMSGVWCFNAVCFLSIFKRNELLNRMTQMFRSLILFVVFFPETCSSFELDSYHQDSSRLVFIHRFTVDNIGFRQMFLPKKNHIKS